MFWYLSCDETFDLAQSSSESAHSHNDGDENRNPKKHLLNDMKG